MAADYEKEHIGYLRKHLAECTVLLKSNGDFPLEAPCEIALYGSGARRTVKGGTGSGEVNSRSYETIEKALKRAGFTITTYDWMDAYDEIWEEARKKFIKEQKERVRHSKLAGSFEIMGAVMPEPEYYLPLNGFGDTAVYVLSRISGEGNDRNTIGGDVLLSGPEIRDIRALQKQYKKFMLILNVGGPVDLSPVMDTKNILVLSQLGAATGSAVADILLGKANPSGKLATTWAAWSDYPSIGDFGDNNDTHYKEGVYVGYKYFDSAAVKPLFAFGHGLSFTTFELSNAKVSVKKNTVSVKAKVKNTGNISGKEVMQVYVSIPEGSLDQPYQTLAAFAKTKELEPGGSESISATFNIEDIAGFDASKAAYVLEAGNYVIRVGTSSDRTEICGAIKLDSDITVKKVRNALGSPDFSDWKPDRPKSVRLPNDVEVISLNASDIPTEEISYDRTEEIDEMIEALSDEDLAYINVGSINPSGGIQNVIGEASQHVAGAAGETTSRFEDKGIPALVMADGPAGLRLSPNYYMSKKGAVTIGSSMLESVQEFLPAPAQYVLKLTKKRAPKGAKVLHQYCTAIPIGTAIAQSWNVDFAKACGDIVGDEMERFNVDLWLAPALNIHRDIRCGRNFEYYSEDPLIAGSFAAALTEGVQAHPGKGVTIKHYAANNQENNRYNNNSMVSERAMREIYLKGFEICVKKASPITVMTSYNLINGEHTSERRDLIEDILRCEFGFEGLVMTDWVIEGMTGKAAVYAAPEPWKVAAAGGDLFMPGSKDDYENIVSALSSGKLDRRQLVINATRVSRIARNLKAAGNPSD